MNAPTLAAALAARHARRPRRERGSATAELVLLTPLLILFVLFIVGLGRLSHARALVNDAAAQAARAATLQYLSPGQAAAAAQQTASDALASAGVACASRSTTVDTGNDHPGGTVTVTLACRVDLSTVTAAGFPGSETLTASFTSPIDTYVPEPLGFAISEVPIGRNRSAGGDRCASLHASTQPSSAEAHRKSIPTQP